VKEAGGLGGRVQVGGEVALVARLRAALMKAMAGRRAYYAVRVERVGPRGDVLVSITGSKGRLPILFAPRELQAAHIASVVESALDEASL
jgi:hypothetical protein